MLKLEPGGSTIPKIPFIRPSFPGPAELAEDFVQIAQANWYTNFGPNERRFARALRDYLGPHLHVATLANGTLAPIRSPGGGSAVFRWRDRCRTQPR